MDLDFFKNLENKLKDEKVKDFIDELKGFLENNNVVNEINKTSKYDSYWRYQNFLEDNVSASIGLSRYANDITYRDELSEAIDDSILELSSKKGTLYRKQFFPNGSDKGLVYDIEKFENGKKENLRVPYSKIPSQYENKDIIFEIKKDGSIKIREDIKKEVINLASKKCEELKVKEDEKANNFKEEGHIYKAIEDDGYIFLQDTTEEGKNIIEDIDFVVDNYEGDGKYQVVNGEYKIIK